jgi:hypothetical protein
VLKQEYGDGLCQQHDKAFIRKRRNSASCPVASTSNRKQIGDDQRLSAGTCMTYSDTGFGDGCSLCEEGDKEASNDCSGARKLSSSTD